MLDQGPCTPHKALVHTPSKLLKLGLKLGGGACTPGVLAELLGRPWRDGWVNQKDLTKIS